MKTICKHCEEAEAVKDSLCKECLNDRESLRKQAKEFGSRVFNARLYGIDREEAQEVLAYCQKELQTY